MVAELRSELRTFEPVSAMSAASAASAAAAAATQPVDPIALQAWCGAVEGRLDEHTTRITGVGLNLEQLIGHAKDAMKLVVDGVGAELTGFKRQVHHDHGKLDAVVVAQIQHKFAEVEGVVQGLTLEAATRTAALDVRTGRAEQRAGLAEQRIAELIALSQAGPAVIAGAWPCPTPASTPPGSPRARG